MQPPHSQSAQAPSRLSRLRVTPLVACWLRGGYSDHSACPHYDAGNRLDCPEMYRYGPSGLPGEGSQRERPMTPVPIAGDRRCSVAPVQTQSTTIPDDFEIRKQNVVLARWVRPSRDI